MADPSGRFVKVYYSVRTDERFARIYHDDRLLATWLRLLMDADAVYPEPATVGRAVNGKAFAVLVEEGVIEIAGPHLFRVHGLRKEREKQTERARNAAAVRWHPSRNAAALREQSGSNADPMLRDETRRDEIKTRRDETGADGEEWDGRDDLEAWVLAKHRVPTPGQRAYLDRYCDTFDLTGPKRAAKIILEHPDDPIGALKADMAAFLAERAAAIVVEPKRPSPRRSGGGLTGINAELAALMREQEEART